MASQSNKSHPPSTHPCLWSARWVGAEVRRLLAPGFSGKVLAVLSHTIYLSGKGGEILWVSPEGLPKHRRCVLTPHLFESVIPGEGFFSKFPHLRFSGGSVIDLAQAEEWDARPVEPEKTVPRKEVEATVFELWGTLPGIEIRDGLGQAVRLFSSMVLNQGLPIFSPDSLVSRASHSIWSVAQACLDQNILRVATTGKELVGLGPGLTPSGDDFLGGLFFAIRFLHRAYPEDFFWEEEPLFDLIEWARHRTHPISHALFHDLVLGHGPEPLHEWITALLSGAELNSIMNAVTRLLSIGHSSGGDILAGMMAGMLFLMGNRNTHEA